VKAKKIDIKSSHHHHYKNCVLQDYKSRGCCDEGAGEKGIESLNWLRWRPPVAAAGHPFGMLG
jgi:hypothetical protein